LNSNNNIKELEDFQSEKRKFIKEKEIFISENKKIIKLISSLAIDKETSEKIAEKLRAEISDNLCSKSNKFNLSKIEKEEPNKKIDELLNGKDDLKSNNNLEFKIQTEYNLITKLKNEVSNLQNKKKNLQRECIEIMNEKQKLSNSLKTLKNPGLLCGNNTNSQSNILNNSYDQLNINIADLMKDRDEYKGKVKIISEEMDKIKIDNYLKMNNLSIIHVNFNSLNEKFVILQAEYEKLQAENAKLQADYTLQLQNAKKLEEEIKNQPNVYDAKCKELTLLSEKLKMQLEKEISEKNNETKRISLILTSCGDEFIKLSDSYEMLLNEIKQQITMNELLNNLVVEFSNRIQTHNHSIEKLDLHIRENIEILTRQSLFIKLIDIIPNSVFLTSSKINIVHLKNKLVKLEEQKLNISQIHSPTYNEIPKFDQKIQTHKNKCLKSNTNSGRNSNNITIDEITNRQSNSNFDDKNINNRPSLYKGMSSQEIIDALSRQQYESLYIQVNHQKKN